jgi:dUTP pyrophosphatase
MIVKIKVIEGGRQPEYKTSGAACADCYARVNYAKDGITIPPGCRTLIPLGFAIELPEGYEAVIRPRSGLTKKSTDVAIGTIDCDYRGEVMACVINSTGSEIKINNHDRICQMKIQKAEQFEFEEVEELSETERADKGFGSTGI